MPCRSQFGSLPAQPGAEARHLMLLSATLGRWSRTGTENGTRLPRSALCHHDPTHVKGMTPQGLPVPPPHACCPCQGFSGVGQGVRAAVVFPRAEQPLPLHHRGSRLAVHSNIGPSDGNGRRNTASGLWLSNHAVKQGGKKKKITACATAQDFTSCTAAREYLPVPILIQMANQPAFLSLSHYISLQQQLS